ncbi:hypothetical protein K2X33_14620 [bacterium]|nr:hypothetical protein [bacterium]
MILHLLLGLVSLAFSEGWEKPEVRPFPVSIEAALHVAKQLDVKVQYESSEIVQLEELAIYSVHDSKTQARLGSVPVPRSEISKLQGQTLEVRLKQLLRTPREQLVAMEQAREAWTIDSKKLETDFGVIAFAVSGDGEHAEIAFGLTENCGMRDGKALKHRLRPVGYLPGCEEYAGGYKAGDLERALFANDALLEVLLERMARNVRECASTGAFWQANIDKLIKSGQF